MHEHDPETENAERQQKDAYDEFEERVRRVRVFLFRCLCSGWFHWKELKFNKRIGHTLTLATLIALILYTCYTVKIYKASNLSASAAQIAAETAAKQEASWEVSQRPWIEISNPSIIQQQTTPPTVPISPIQPLLQNDPYNFQVVIRVYGNTPALHSYAKMNPRFVPLPHQVNNFLENVPTPILDSCSRTAPWEKSDGVLFPTGTYPWPSNSQIAMEEDIRKWIYFQEALYWIGCVRYEDAFSRRYQTNFCFYLVVNDTPPGWKRCLTGNELIEYSKEH
jgi:hypothetical protein